MKHQMNHFSLERKRKHMFYCSSCSSKIRLWPMFAFLMKWLSKNSVNNFSKFRQCQSSFVLFIQWFDFYFVSSSPFCVAAYLPVCKSVFLEMRAFRLGVTFCVAQSSGHEPKVCAKRESSLKRLSLCACLALAPTCLKNTKKK